MALTDVKIPQIKATEKSSKLTGTYNDAEFMPERKKMMEAWADYLDSLRNLG